MKRLVLCALFSLALLLTGLAGLTVTAPPATAAAGDLLFVDTFNGPAGPFDSTKWKDWSYCSFNPAAAYGRIQCGDNEKLDGKGHLVIPAMPDRGSALSTANRFSFTYGTVSAWIKVPRNDGYWPAFWTLNNGLDGIERPLGGEIDVMEQYTSWDDEYHRGVHNWNGNAWDQSWGGVDDPTRCSNGADLTTGFHKYSARVEPGKITFFFDDVQCGEPVTTAMGNGKPWTFGPDIMDPNFLILTLAVGGADQAPATRGARMLVNRVEVRSIS